MNSQNVERAHFDQFRALVRDVPEGTLVHGDAPDFLVQGPTETVGVELTRVFKPTPASIPQQAAFDSTAEAIVSEARAFAEKLGTPPAMVCLYFNLRSPIKRAEREGIAEAIAHLIYDNVPEPGHTITLEYGLDADPRHVQDVDLIFIHRLEDNNNHDWAQGNAVRVEGNTHDIFQSAIDKKAALLGSYLTKCDSCWLLLYAEFMKQAQALSPDSQSASYIYTSPFERTYFLNSTQNAVWRLDTRPPIVSGKTSPQSNGGTLMNPFKWPAPHRVALLITMVIGALAGVLIGYLVYGVARGADGGVSFQYWISHFVRYAGIWWGLTGAAVGCGLFYIWRLSSK